MTAGIYARFSSENQRPESIEDQVAACRKEATRRGLVVADEHVYADVAASGARSDRDGLASLLNAGRRGCLQVVLVDDLSRLARNAHLMLATLAELAFHGVRVIAVADGLDSAEEDSALAIQVRGIFNELQLSDLRKRTLRGQMGQKRRGYFVGEKTFGYRSVACGTTRMDKKQRQRPEGYRMEIEPGEAAVVRRVFAEFAAGRSQSAIVRLLNVDEVRGQRQRPRAWSPATINRILRNTKYIGRWSWNKTATRRDPATGRPRQFPRPEADWIVQVDEALRIVPQELWDRVQRRLALTTKEWPGRHEAGQPLTARAKPSRLLSSSMVCGRCGGAVAVLSGKSGGYYGCLAATRAACANRLLVRVSIAESAILAAVQNGLTTPEHLDYVERAVAKEVSRLQGCTPDPLRLKRKELAFEERRVRRFIELIGEGHRHDGLGEALASSERRVDELRAEIAAQAASPTRRLNPPPCSWIEGKLAQACEVFTTHAEDDALNQCLRRLLGPIRLLPVAGKEHRSAYYRAETHIGDILLTP